MTPKPPDSTVPPQAAQPASGQPGTVKVQKRVMKEPDPNREKICASCGQPFVVSPDQKYFNCPECYRKAQPVRKAPRKSEAQILTQITCMECGTIEYLDFVPTDLNATYCHSCFSKKRQELQATKSHPDRK
jgi:NMD protein affecting ribosome stability and mRNA decay